ncbi:MAG: hypothetical protein ABII09_12405 [Planctomycetota bacterium]
MATGIISSSSPVGETIHTPPRPQKYRLPRSSMVIPSGSLVRGGLVGLKKTEPVPSVPSGLMGKTHHRLLVGLLLLLSATYSLVSSREVIIPLG